MKNGVAIITARGGSKRIPKKNIREFCGKPIIAYSIGAAINSGCFDEVMVSTDSEEIAEIAKSYGAKVPFYRSEQNANDYAVTAEVLKEVFLEYKNRGEEFEYGCCIYPTAPFVTSEKLILAMRALISSDADSLMTVMAYSFPPQRAVQIKDGYLSMLYPEYMNSRSQDMEKIYHDCGQFYAFRVEQFMKSGKLITGKTIPFIVDELEVQDIDTETDWKLAEIKYNLWGGNSKAYLNFYKEITAYVKAQFLAKEKLLWNCA